MTESFAAKMKLTSAKIMHLIYKAHY